ncbi:MAG: Ig-like domain-containing protein [Ignavibacteriae bacterium]|nr:Ig-like domain-containing protein [Ignavibacteriota bacterium]
MKLNFLILALIVVMILVGCSNDDSMTTMNNQPISSLTIAPTDGATNVRLDESITFTFIKPVDKKTTERNIHLVSQFAMADSLCPVNNMMAHGDMNMAMMDSMKMNHLMNQHNSLGRFTWNGDSTQCTFTPDSMMMPNMQYMIHMGQEMMQMMQSRMGNMGMMNNHGTGMTSNDMMYHFRTMDTTQADGGHDSHHGK